MIEETGYWKRQLSRRRALAGAGIAGAGIAAITLGCRTEERPATTQQVVTPKRGGTLVIGQTGGALEELDPQIDSTINAKYSSEVYEGLIAQNHFSLEIEPEVSEKWEQPSDTEYIFTLRPGVRFHNKPPVNGRELTMDDVLFNLQRIQTENPRFTSRPFLLDVKVEAVDRSRLKFTTKAAEASFLAKLGGTSMKMLAREALQQAGAVSEPGKMTRPELAIGTGPFMYKSIQEGVSTELERNPAYWDANRPYLDGLRRLALYLTQPNDRGFAAFQGGQIDVVAVPGPQVKRFIESQGPGYTPAWAKDPSPFVFTPNVKVKPYDDARVTRALRLLIDHDEFVTAWADLWLGRGAFGSFFPASYDVWEIDQQEFRTYTEWAQPKDAAVREAMSLLNAAGFNRDNPLKFDLTAPGEWWEFPQAGGVLLQSQFRRLGQGVIEAQMRLIPDNATYQTVRGRKDYTVGFLSTAASFDEPDALFSQAYHSKGARNYWQYEDPQLDSMIDRQRTIFKLDERKAYVKDVLRYLIQNHPGVLVATGYYLNALKPKVQGFTPEVHFQGREYKNVWLEA
jgi:peptide/nickel transport system substrate-binding protein